MWAVGCGLWAVGCGGGGEAWMGLGAWARAGRVVQLWGGRGRWEGGRTVAGWFV